jgi:zinc transport system substrate-binding protein
MRTILTLVIVIALAGSLGACDGAAPDDGRRSIVTAVYPLEEAAARIGGDRVVVTNLTPPGIEPHDLELTPDDLELIAEADLVLYLGGGFQPAVEDAIDAAATGTTVDVLSAVGERGALLPDPDGELAQDPHVWLDPARYLDVVAVVTDALAGTDPPGAPAFDAAAAAWRADLEALVDDYEVLRSCDRDLLVTGHRAFGYLAEAYGLREAAIAGVSPEAEPGPARLAEIRALVADEGVTTVYTEELLPSDYADTIAAETGAEVRLLHTIESRTDAQREAGIGYEELMRENLTALTEGLGCG